MRRFIRSARATPPIEWRTLASACLNLAFVSQQPLLAEQPLMKAVIDGQSGLLPKAVVSSVWAEAEVVIRFLEPDDGARRVLLKGADTTFVADGFRFRSDRVWKVTGKQTYFTADGVQRSILVAEPVGALQQGSEGCVDPRRHTALCRRKSSRIVQILGVNEMLVDMHVSPPLLTSEMHVLLLRGVDTAKLTEDSQPPPGRYPITGTYRYSGINGGVHTVFVADATQAEADRIAEQRRREEEHRELARAARNAMAEQEVAEKAERERKAKEEAAKWRTWMDSSGRFRLEAKLNGIIDGNASLKKRDGTVVRVPLGRLSDDDQKWIKEWTKWSNTRQRSAQ
jgi:SLA1 homology domain 1, SHD1